MSDGGYYVNTRNRQLEIATLLSSIEMTVGSMRLRQSKIESVSEAIVEPVPPRILNFKKDPSRILGLSRQWKISETPSLISPVASRTSWELQKSIETMVVTPAMISQERALPNEAKTSLAEVRSVTIDTIRRLLEGKSVEGVKLDGFRLLKQDGNIFEVEAQIQEGNEKTSVRSKICILDDGSAVIYQDSHYSGTTCDKAARQFAGTLDLALAKTYVAHFALPANSAQRKAYREIASPVNIGGVRVTLEKSMCG